MYFLEFTGKALYGIEVNKIITDLHCLIVLMTLLALSHSPAKTDLPTIACRAFLAH